VVNGARLAVVTGGAGGIGAAIVAELVRSRHRVVALGRDAEALEALSLGVGTRGTGAGVGWRVCDVTSEEQVKAVFGELGTVQVLVNAAGVARTAPLQRTTLADWEHHFGVNATGSFLTMRAVLPGMRAAGSGRLICVASTAGRVGSPYTAAYTASKHAVVGLVRVVAAEVAGTGITSNAVCPTFTRTPMTDESVARIVEKTGLTEAEAERRLADAAPLGRLLEPAEVAAAVGYLASDAAAAVNGQTLVLDGGGIP
jgi:NAD(P)-dependent dehydrogenase (short-subunit alcohol dehydrogenase family)